MHEWSRHATRSSAAVVLAICGLLAAMAMTGADGAGAATSAWKKLRSANATRSGGRIESVSCSAASACTAVGTYLNISGIKVTLAERWNGRTWQLQRTPNPAADTTPAVSPDLRGVSCPARNFCEAVGTYQLGSTSVSLAETWNGSRWSRQQLPAPAGSSSASLVQVSCTSATFCEAVGSFQDGVGDTLTLAERWNGTSWRLQHPANPPGASSVKLNAVSCFATTFCEAGGGSDSSAATFAERWNGTSWRVQVVPGTGGVKSVSCVSTSFCEAVGPGGADSWNGTRWTAQTIPSPLSADAVSCASPTNCEAVGAFNNNGPVVGSAAKWNGSAWRVQSAPNPARATFTNLTGVSCASAKSCHAVGFFERDVTAGDPKALAEAWNGQSWRLQHAVAPAGATDNTLAAVSCVSTSFCEAVGSYLNSTNNSAGLAEQWNGTSWRIQPVPSPPTTGGNASETLDSVSCVSASFCAAVGVGSSGPNAEMWNGTSWQLQTRPGTAVRPESVSCASVDFCMSVNGFGQVDIWGGSSWSAGLSVPGFSFVAAVSCVSASFCEAVGSGPSGENAATWDGTSWSAQPTAGPPSVVMNSISCSDVNWCEVVGSFVDQGASQPVTLAENWDGSTWALQPTPNPSAAQMSSLRSVSCTSSSSCTAVGDYQFSFLNLTHTLAEVWNGTAWSLRSTPSNANAGQNILSGVSCGASSACMAAGQTEDIGLIPATLIEAGD